MRRFECKFCGIIAVQQRRMQREVGKRENSTFERKLAHVLSSRCIALHSLGYLYRSFGTCSHLEYELFLFRGSLLILLIPSRSRSRSCVTRRSASLRMNSKYKSTKGCIIGNWHRKGSRISRGTLLCIQQSYWRLLFIVIGWFCLFGNWKLFR